jgi:H+/Cl- antiporter ClcA
VHKREFLCAGVSAGVSAAFAAPIGGSLFAYELSKHTAFWNFAMIWRSFFCCSVSTYTISFLNQIRHHGFIDLKVTSGGTIKFGELQNLDVKFNHLHGAIMLGIFGGALGSLFINVNTRMTLLRKKYVTKNWVKVVETGFFAVMTVSTYVAFTAFVGQCIDENPDWSEEKLSELRHWTCPKGQYNPMATLFFNTEGGTIRSLMQDDA